MLKELHLISTVLFSPDWRRMVSSFGNIYSRIDNLSAGKCQGIFFFHFQLFNRVSCLVLGAQNTLIRGRLSVSILGASSAVTSL